MGAFLAAIGVFVGVLVVLFMMQNEFPKTLEGFFAWLKASSAATKDDNQDGA